MSDIKNYRHPHPIRILISILYWAWGVAPANETPDGTIVKDDRIRVSKWGACWNRYYKLEIEYYMSGLAQDTLEAMNNQFLWHKSFTQSVIHHVDKQAQHLQQLKIVSAQSIKGSKKTKSSSAGEETTSEADDVVDGPSRPLTTQQALTSLVNDHTCAICSLLAKKMIFTREQRYLLQASYSQHVTASSWSSSSASVAHTAMET